MLTVWEISRFASSWRCLAMVVCSVAVWLGTSLIPQPGLAQTLTASESTPLTASADQLTVAVVNVNNLSPKDSDRFELLAHLIVDNLAAPDVITLVNIQDNDGPEQTLVTAADNSYNQLIDAIQAADGPTYAAVDISPQRNQDGGQLGSNSRVGYLFQPERLALAEGPHGDATTTVEVLAGPHLSLNPGRIAPNSAAFKNSRKPLAAEFVFNSQSLFLIGNHFIAQSSGTAAAQRLRQAKVVRSLVIQLLAADGGAKIIVLGNLNDDAFSKPLKTIADDRLLTNLAESLIPSDRYSFKSQGNLQLVDHILVSPELFVNADAKFDIVHGQVGFPDAVTDHDPVMARFTLLSPDASPESESEVTPDLSR